MANTVARVAGHREGSTRRLLLQVGVTSVVLTELVRDGVPGLARQHLEEVSF